MSVRSARRRVRTGGVATLALLALGTALVACSDDDEIEFPVRSAPPSRHSALIDGLADDARALAFDSGDWQEDRRDAAFYGLAWSARRAGSGGLDAAEVLRRDAALARAKTLLAGDVFADAHDAATSAGPMDSVVEEQIMAALGVIEYVGASRDRSVVPVLDGFVDRLDAYLRSLGDYVDSGASPGEALTTYGPTAVTAVIALVEAQYALLVGGERAKERTDRVVAIDAKIRERALGDLVDVATGRRARGYAFAPGQRAVVDAPNLAMLLLKTRLFRLTKREEFRLEARAVYAALQPLKLTDAPARYSSPYAKSSLALDTRDVSTLPGQNYLTLALLLLFEITGDQRFVDEADRVVDGIAAMRGPWCTSHLHDPAACAPSCATGDACVSTTCTPDRCTTGLLDHVVDGRLALPADGRGFCSGCNLQTLYVAGYRRSLARESY